MRRSHPSTGLWAVTFLAIGASSGAASAQAPAAGPVAPPVQDCSSAAHRRLDFRIGEFDVTGIGGAKAGVSRVESLLGGCLLVEHWQAALSGYGKAFFYYDRRAERWHTTFVRDDGEALVFEGVFEGDALVFRGEGKLSPFEGLHRMAWSPLPNGGVKQFWEVSTDGGSTWKTIHIGNYVRRR